MVRRVMLSTSYGLACGCVNGNINYLHGTPKSFRSSTELFQTSNKSLPLAKQSLFRKKLWVVNSQLIFCRMFSRFYFFRTLLVKPCTLIQFKEDWWKSSVYLKQSFKPKMAVSEVWTKSTHDSSQTKEIQIKWKSVNPCFPKTWEKSARQVSERLNYHFVWLLNRRS